MRLTLFVLAILALRIASADSCSDILRDGVMNELTTYESFEEEKNSVVTMCRTKNDNMQSGGKFNYGYEASGSLDMQKYRQACDQFNNQGRVSKESFTTLKAASEVIVNAWTHCMDFTPPLRFSLQGSAVAGVFRAHLAHHSKLDVDVSLTNVSQCTCEKIEGTTCSGAGKGKFKLGVNNGATRAILSCQKADETKQVVATAIDSGSGATAEVSLPGEPPGLAATPQSATGACVNWGRPGITVAIKAARFPADTVPVEMYAVRDENITEGVQPLDLWQNCSPEASKCEVTRDISAWKMIAEGENAGIYLRTDGGVPIQVLDAVQGSGGYGCGGGMRYAVAFNFIKFVTTRK